jgi:ATP-binding cassette subfamily B (MDR/TAP) protein 8
VPRTLCQGLNTQSFDRTAGYTHDVRHETDTQFPWREFFKLLLPDVWFLLGAVVSAFAVALINVEIPLLLGGLVNVLAKYASQDSSCNFLQDVRLPAVKLISMYSVQGALTFVYISLLSSMAERLAARLRERLFEAVIVQDIAFFDANKTGEIVNRLTTDIQDFKSSLKLCISQGLKSSTQTLGCILSMSVVSPKLTLVMSAVVIAIIGVGSLMGSGLRVLSRKAQAQIAKSTAVADEALGNVRTVRAFAMEPTEIKLFAREVEKSSNLNQLLGLGIGVFQGLSNIALNGLVLGSLYVGGYLMSQGEVTAGDLMAFMVATQTIQRSLGQMSMLFGQVIRGLTAGSRVFEYMLLRPEIAVTGGKIIPYHTLTGSVEFQSVNFSYPTRPDQQVLKDFSLKVPGGRMVALVGLSGNGKSTVAALLERFYDVSSGRITLDGQDIKTLDPSWLRGRVIGFINQEPVLFATTVMENIRYGRPDATDTEVIEAAKLANADGFITTFPNGYKTVLGERGVTVSGGQKQRIAIARALLKNPTILILDEATSALDAESERVVQDALDHIVKGRTVLVIAHRLSTVRDADVIAVVSGGQIVEMGTHSQLKRQRGFYWQLIRNQEQLNEGFAARIFN